MNHRLMVLATAVLFTLANAQAPLATQQGNGVFGDWREAEGSVIRIAPCADRACAVLVAISPSAPTREDGKNPDPALRHRPLCGLTIGTDFHLVGTERAENGTLYDPKSGKTYHGSMEAHGDQLNLRGYIGVPMFGRTEKWSRIAPVASCSR